MRATVLPRFLRAANSKWRCTLRGERTPKGPHSRDEVYVVVRGSGMFRNGSERHPFGPGDLLFVAAGVPHRSEQFTDDLALWVLFYGPPEGTAG
ncbi:MAG: cupin domain-containing protein [Thermoplasmatota archaeon]